MTNIIKVTLAPSLLAAAVAFAQVDAETEHTLGIALQLAPQPPPAKPKPEPDSLILNSGAQIVGELESATAAAVTFREQSLGELTIAWSKIKEIRSSHVFAVIPKGVKVTNKEEAKAIPEGTVSVADKNIQIAQTGAGPLVEPVANTAHVVARDDFDQAFESPGVFGNWSGSVDAGASLITATQNVTNLTAGLNLARNVPGVDWRDPSNRTLIDYDMSYSWNRNTLPTNRQLVRTFIYEAKAERDEYFLPRLYGFGQLIFNHNFAQNLALAQTYVAGLGVVAVKRGRQELDFRGTLGYIDRGYYASNSIRA